MRSFIQKLTASAVGAVVLIAGCVMAGLGLAVVGLLSLFAVAVLGLALIAAPFLAPLQQGSDDLEFNSIRNDATEG